MIADYIAWFFGGAFLFNSLPHLVNGMSGRRFPSPFAKPPGKGESSATVNAVWGVFNVALGYVLLVHVGEFRMHAPWSELTALFGGLATACGLAWRFGPLYGGDKGQDRL